MSMKGISEAIPYEEIQAYQATNGIATYSADSGRQDTGGLYVLWDSVSGFTESGWYNRVSENADSRSPAYIYTDEEIAQMIEEDGDLDRMFRNWPTNYPDYDGRYRFILDKLPDNCVEG